LSHEQAEQRYQNRPPWQRRPQQRVTSSEHQSTASPCMDSLDPRRCGKVRRCTCWLQSLHDYVLVDRFCAKIIDNHYQNVRSDMIRRCFSQFGADFYCIVHTGDMDCCDTGMLGRLSQEKHFERQLRGRRQSSLGPVVNQPVTDPGQPRQPSADWRIPGVCELLRQHNVQLLEVIILSFLRRHISFLLFSVSTW